MSLLRRRMMMAQKPSESGDIILTPNATTEDNKRAYELFEKDGIFDGIANVDWEPQYSDVGVYITGIINNVSFDRMPVIKAQKYTQVDWWDVYFDGLYDLGVVMVSYLTPDGTYNAYDDD